MVTLTSGRNHFQGDHGGNQHQLSMVAREKQVRHRRGGFSSICADHQQRLFFFSISVHGSSTTAFLLGQTWVSAPKRRRRGFSSRKDLRCGILRRRFFFLSDNDGGCSNPM